jgi:hypothetical protein
LVLALVLGILQASQYAGVCYRNFWAPIFDVAARAVAHSAAFLTGAGLSPSRREPQVSDFLLNGAVVVSWNALHLETMVSVLALVFVFPGAVRRKLFYALGVVFCFWAYNACRYAWYVHYPDAANYFVYKQSSMPDWASAVTGVLQGLPAALALALAGGWILLNRPNRQPA